MIDKADQVRAHVERNPFPEATARTVGALYKPEAEFRALLERDAAQFQKAVEATGARVGATEPIVAVAERFEAEVDLPSAAAELGMTPAAFLDALGKTRELASRLGGLKVQGQTVQREVLLTGFQELVQEFGLGTPLHRLTKLIAEKSDAIKHTPNNPSPYFERGNAHFDRGDYERASADYTDAIRFQIKGADVFLFRGMAQANRRDYVRAIEDYGVAIRLDPQRAESYHQRGLALAKKGEQRAALRDLSEAVRLDPQDAEALSNRGVVLGRLGEYAQARADFDAALRLRPTDVALFVRRGDVLVRKGDHRIAIAAYDEAIRRGLKGANVHLRRGEAHALKRAYAEALADYRTAVRVDPRSANAHNGTAWLLAVAPDERLRDGKQAIEHARRACALGAYANFEHLDTLAAAHAERGEFPRGRQVGDQSARAGRRRASCGKYRPVWNCMAKRSRFGSH